MRVLVVGHERSATTWVGQVLGATASSGVVNEPDDPCWHPFAIRAMARRGMLPVLTAQDEGSRALVQLWDVAFGVRRTRFVRGQGLVTNWLLRSAAEDQRRRMQAANGRLTPRLRVAGLLGVPKHLGYAVEPEHRVVKSVHAPLMIDWITARWDPAVVVCFRNPLDVVASFLAVGLFHERLIGGLSSEARNVGTDLYGVPVPSDANPVALVAWRVGLVMSALADACRLNGSFHVVDHEETCQDPVGRLRALVAALGLTWTSDTEAFVAASNRPGTKWETSRVASEQGQRWRGRIAPDDARSALRVLAQFPITARYEPDLSL